MVTVTPNNIREFVRPPILRQGEFIAAVLPLVNPQKLRPEEYELPF